ncbi:MAG: GspE/PulE family protein, partial [Thermodesulfobacteriota bacterium]
MMRSLEEIIGERNPEVKVKLDEVKTKNGERFEDIIIKSNLIGDEDVLKIFSEFYEIPHLINLTVNDIDPELIKILPISFAKRFRLIPLKKENGKLLVAMAPPVDLYVLDEVRSLFECELEPYIALNHVVMDCINKVYERDKEVSGEIEHESIGISEAEFQEPKDLLEADDEAPIIRFVNSLLFQAVKEKASDIHIECFEKEVVVRFRKDGILHKITKVAKKLQSSVISRVKIMAELDIAEKRKPQDGRIRVKVSGRDVDVRISTVPTTHGESIVMRIL